MIVDRTHYNVVIIEVAAEPFGAVYKGLQTGAFGEYNGISFNGNKVLETDLYLGIIGV